MNATRSASLRRRPSRSTSCRKPSSLPNFLSAQSKSGYTDPELAVIFGTHSLGRLPYVERRNPHYRSAAPMQLYVEAKVERLAYRLHGGYRAHVQLCVAILAFISLSAYAK